MFCVDRPVRSALRVGNLLMMGQAAMPRLFCWCAILAACFTSGRAGADLQIAGYQDRLHDPYYVGADKAFIGEDYDWSGVGRFADPAGTSANWKSVVMISDNYFITAFHNRPYRGNDPAGSAPKVRFYRSLDPQGEFWESEIALATSEYEGQRIGLTDLWVGKLATTPPEWVMRYPLAKRHEATNYLSYTDNELMIFGQDSPRNWTSVRVGRNEIDEVDIGGNYSWDFDAAGGLGADEAETQPGDSGAPSFYTSGQTPVLAGIHTRENFDTGVSKNLDAILAIVKEPVALSTGLVGDVNGDFRVTARDLDFVLDGFGKTLNAFTRPADFSGDGMIDVRDVNAFLDGFGRSLYAPTDFDQDGDVDSKDLVTIGHNWLKSVKTPFTMGDANGDGFVNAADVEVFDQNQFRAVFGPLPAPLSPVPGDLTSNGVVDGFDLSQVTQNLNKVVAPGTSGDADGNGVVNQLDLAFVSMRLGTSFGDLNGDGEVGSLDFTIIANNWFRPVTGGRAAGDLNGDRWVTYTDAQILFQWWGQQGGEFPGMLVPEPGCGMLVVCGAIAALAATGRRRAATSRGPW